MPLSASAISLLKALDPKQFNRTLDTWLHCYVGEEAAALELEGFELIVTRPAKHDIDGFDAHLTLAGMVLLRGYCGQA